MKKSKQLLENSVSAGLCASVLLVAGCLQTNMTNPARSATEQLLLSTAADRAMDSSNLVVFSGKKVYVDTSYFDSYDSKNAIGTVRDALNSAGALLVSTQSNADVIVEARSGALAIDYTQTLIGMPQMGLPVPLTGVVPLPEIDLYKTQQQYSLAKIALLAYSRTNGEHYFSSGPMVGRAHNKYYTILFISWTRTDIPEKKKPKHHQEAK